MRRIAIVTAFALLALGSAVWAAEPLTKRDSAGGVTVTVTLLGWPAPGGPLKAKVVLDTHSIDLDAVSFERSVVLRTPEGTETKPTAVEQVGGGGHHRQAVVVFAVDTAAPRLVVKDVGGVAERTFAWSRPGGTTY